MGFFEKPPRVLKEPQVEPGYDSLIKYFNRKNDDLRLPAKQELANAFQQFIAYKKAHNRALTAIQARCINYMLDYICHEKGVPSDVYFLRIADLRAVQDVLLTAPREDAADHVKLAKAVYDEIRTLQAVEPTGKREEVETAIDLAVLVRILSRYGSAVEARDTMLDFWTRSGQDNPDIGSKRTKDLWFPILRGLADEGREPEVKDFVRRMEEEARIPYNRRTQEIMTTFYAQRDEFEQMEFWFQQPIPPTAPPSHKTYRELFRCALRNDQREWALSIYQKLVNDTESLPHRHFTRETLLVVYEWAILLHGKGLEHIEHMMKANAERRPDDTDFQPSIDTINGLIEAAVEKNDSYLAERFIALAHKLELEPNRRTYSLQIQYRLAAKDLDGAFSAYRSLQNFDGHQEDDLLLNRLIRDMCEASSPFYEGILDIISYLEQRLVTLEAETVVSICLTFLKNDEHYEVIDTLSLHTIQASPKDRELICKAFVNYCLDRVNSTARVWDAYTLLRQFFPDATREDRIKVMDAFFDRKRGDMATHVFGHMRQQTDSNSRPILETYVRCLEGIGRCPDLESLKILHNMLKMDTTVTPNTQLYNALMLAHTACEEHYRALDFWMEISNSVEGPSYNTLEIVFRTFQGVDRGGERAQALWEKLQKMEVDVPPNVYTAYAACQAAHSRSEEVKTLLEDMDEAVGKRPDPLT